MAIHVEKFGILGEFLVPKRHYPSPRP